MKTARKFWLLDFDEEGEIYDNPAWDMPGLKKHPLRGRKGRFRFPALRSG